MVIIMDRVEGSRESIKRDLAAIIVAAGYSSRMEAFKPLLPLGESTVIESSISSFLEAGIENTIVVVGFKANMLKPILEQMDIKWVYNKNYSEGMFSSIVAGVKSLPSHVKGFFLLPADIPIVRHQTIDILSQNYDKHDIIYPVYKNRRGHPPLISSKLFPEILRFDGQGGLKALLKKHNDSALHIEVDDEGILLDMDTYEDYLMICKKLKAISEKQQKLQMKAT